MIAAKSITKEIISTGLSYHEYRALIASLFAEGKVTGLKQTPARLEFTSLNMQRMNRLDKTVTLLPELAARAATLRRKQTWVLLSQGWCGDCAQLVPVIAKIAEAGGEMIDLRIINPDEQPEVMDAYRTNGSLSVPKLVILDAVSLEELATWGPRPAPAQKIMLDWKHSENPVSWADFEKELHTWYAKDKTLTTQEEFLGLPSWPLVT